MDVAPVALSPWGEWPSHRRLLRHAHRQPHGRDPAPPARLEDGHLPRGGGRRPGDWMVEPWRPICGVTASTVFMRRERISTLYCPEFMTGAAELIVGSRIVARRPSVAETINGLRATMSRDNAIYHGHLSGTITSIFVRLLSQGFSITVISRRVGELLRWRAGPSGKDRPHHSRCVSNS